LAFEFVLPDFLGLFPFVSLTFLLVGELMFLEKPKILRNV